MLKNKLKTYVAEEGGLDEMSALEGKNAAQIMVPFAQLDLFKIAQKEETKYVRKARILRFQYRAGAILFALLTLGLMLYNAFGNRSSMRRAGQMGDKRATDNLYQADPQYKAAVGAFEAATRTLNARETESMRKIALYRAEGKESRTSYWLAQATAVQRERASAQAKLDSVTVALKTEAQSAVKVNNDYVFHELLAFALPLMVFLCALGAERLDNEMGTLLWCAMFLLQIPNAYLVQASIAHAFNAGAFDLPGIGRTSPFAVIVGIAVLLGEPLAYYVASKFMHRFLEGWHDALQKIIVERCANTELRSAIREDLQAEKEAVIENTIALNQKWLQARRASIATQEEAKTHALEAAEAQAQVEQEEEVLAMIPRASTTTALAKKILAMEADGTYDALLQKITQANIAKFNGLNDQTLRAALSNARKARDTRRPHNGTAIAEEILVEGGDNE